MDTTYYQPQISGAKLVIIENDEVRVCELAHRSQWLVGRIDPNSATEPEIPFSSRIVSRKHGSFRNIDGQWYYVDEPENLNGTFYNGVKMQRPLPGRKKSVPLANGDILRVDNADLDRVSSEGVLMLFTTDEVSGSWTALSLDGRESLCIGRDRSCELCEPLAYFSARHAKLSLLNGKWYISDCGSTAGTYVNGEAVTKSRVLREKDRISICDRSYFFLGSKILYVLRNADRELWSLRQTIPAQRPVVLKADIDTKRVKDNNGTGTKELIKDIHLEIRQGTLVALLGTAGAGKSTLMNCLNGMDLEGVQGSVLYRGVDLMKNFDRMKSMIGSVPQQKIFHKTFTPEKELRLAARKRLPADTTKQEIEARVNRTLQMLSMDGVRKNKNSKLSGGEQTRVNVGIELVADRDLLCLDEPDQGLSPNYKHELFEIMRSLAHQSGKSVLSIIHDVSEIDIFDQVIILAKVEGVGRLAFSGSPAEGRKFFGVDIKDAYALLEREPEKFINKR